MIEPGAKALFLTISSAKSALRNVIVIVAYFRLHQLSAIAQDMRVRALNFLVPRLFACAESLVRDDGAILCVRSVSCTGSDLRHSAAPHWQARLSVTTSSTARFGRDAGRRRRRYFGLTEGSPPGVPGGGMTGIGSAE